MDFPAVAHFSLPRYFRGTAGRGFGRVILLNPLPSPPPDYRGREKAAERSAYVNSTAA
jgi:hypothetical protein